MMDKKYIVLSIVLSFVLQITHSQSLEQNEGEALVKDLNTTLASEFKVELKDNKFYCNIDQLSKTLDLRDNSEIAEDSLTKQAKTKLYTGRYAGPVYWMYNFQSATNSEVMFKANKYQQLFCTIKFDEQDTIVIRSRLNAYTSYHKTSDAALHIVEWTGDKYISFLLTLKRIDNKHEMEVNGITLSGKFQRYDNKELSKNYTKSLRKILKREFKTLFKSDEMTALLSLKIEN